MRKTLFWTIAIALVPTWALAATFLVRPDLFYFRAWEYFEEIPYRVDGYPLEWNRFESGDLSRDTLLFRRDAWLTHVTTDAGGFRSVPDMGRWPLVVFLGDSNTFGSGLSDNETVPWIVSELAGVPVFNAAREDDRIGAILSDPRMACVQVVVEVRAERNLGSFPAYRDGRFRPTLSRSSDRWLLDRIDPRRWFAPAILGSYLSRAQKDLDLLLWHSEDLDSFRAPVGFANGVNPEDRAKAVANIAEKSTMLAERGLSYIVMEAPASGAVFFAVRHSLPAPDVCVAAPDGNPCRSRSLDDLDADLGAIGVRNVNLAPEFRSRVALGEELFHPYDTHWSAAGAMVAAEQLAAYLDQPNLIDMDKFSECVSEHALTTPG